MLPWLLLLVAAAPAAESINGVDDDGDGWLPAVEVDCDDDGAYARPPRLPDGPVDDAAELGLTDCHDVEIPPTLVCFGRFLETTCLDSGLWGLDVAELEVIGVMEDGARVGQDSGTCSTWDCDDLCPLRCEGREEICDGIDNDCVDVPATAIPGGLPFAQWGPVPGWVAEGEFDRDGDGHVTCAGDLSASDAWIVEGCSSTVQDGDCLEGCFEVAPWSPPQCGGFAQPATCQGSVRDADGDGHVPCPDGPRLIHALAATVGSPFFADPPLVPLLPPRDDAVPCDDALRASLQEIGLWPAPPGEPPVASLLEACIAADVCRAREQGRITSAWPDDCASRPDLHCGVLALDLASAQDNPLEDVTLDDCLDLAHDYPEQAAARTVWSADRIRQARTLVTDWDCYRSRGTWGCADEGAPAGWTDPWGEVPALTGGFTANPLSASLRVGTSRWWKEFARFTPRPVAGLVETCWEEPRVPGDCDDADPARHRDALEGPADPVALMAGDASCATCTDGIDNDCDGLVDCADDDCAPCYAPFACAGDSEEDCGRLGGGCQSAPRSGFAPLVLLLALLGVRRRR